MIRCKSYQEVYKPVTTYDWLTGNPIRNYVKTGLCNGTKEQDECSCGGNRCNCDFYETARKQAQTQEILQSIPEQIADLIIKVNSVSLDNGRAQQDIIDKLLEIKFYIEQEVNK